MIKNYEFFLLVHNLDLTPKLLTQEHDCTEQRPYQIFSISRKMNTLINYGKHQQGFQFSFQRGGGMVPPLRGGDTRGGNRSGRGGNAARNITTIGLNSVVYLMII